MNEPLDPKVAKQLANEAMTSGRTIFDDHVTAQMKKRKISMVEVYRTIRAGAPQPAELENGSWR